MVVTPIRREHQPPTNGSTPPAKNGTHPVLSNAVYRPDGLASTRPHSKSGTNVCGALLEGGRPDSDSQAKNTEVWLDAQAERLPNRSRRWTKGKASKHVAMHRKSAIDKAWLHPPTKTYSNGCRIPFRGNPRSIPAPSRGWASLRRWQITMSGVVGSSGWGVELLRFLK